MKSNTIHSKQKEKISIKKRIFNLVNSLKKAKMRIAALIMAAITLIPTVPAFALNVGSKESFTRTWVSGVYFDTGRWTDGAGNTHYSISGQFSNLNLKSTGEPVYCLEPDNSINLSKDATARDFRETDAWRNLSPTANILVTRASIWGYPTSTYGYSASVAQAATNIIIWDAVMGKRTGYEHGLKDWVTQCTSDVRNCYNAILDAMSNHASTPVFNKTSITLNGSGKSNGVTITDTKGVLNQFNVASTNSNIKAEKSGNNITVYCTSNGNYTGTITLTKQNTDIGSALALTGADQTVLYGKIADPINLPLRITVQAMKCNLSVAKEDSETNAILDGAKFKVQQWSNTDKKYYDYKTLAESTYNGTRRYTATDLQYTEDNGGWFKVVEVNAPTGYENSPVFIPSGSYTSTTPGEFRLTEDMNGKTFSYTVKNAPQKGTLEVIKTTDDNHNEGHRFRLSGISAIGRTVDLTATTDENGVARFENVYIGTSYVLEEVDTFIQYIVPPEQTAVIKWNEVTKNNVHNELKTSDLSVIKTSENGEKEGFRFHLYGVSTSGANVSEYATTDKSPFSSQTRISLSSGSALS